MWPRERRQFRLGGTKHLDCVVREVRCKADASTFREMLELTLQQEIARMRELGASPDAIAAFRPLPRSTSHCAARERFTNDADSVEQASDNPGRKNR